MTQTRESSGRFTRISYEEISVGTHVGRWTVTGEMFMKTNASGVRAATFPCKCDCGTVRAVSAWKLRNETSKGCTACMPRGFNAKRQYPSGSDHPGYLGEDGGQARKRAWLKEEKAKPCVDCGRCFPYYCMELDHVPERGEKSFAINLCSVPQKWTLEELKIERAKCDLVCAVCHNHRTWERRSGFEHSPLPEEFFKEEVWQGSWTESRLPINI